MIQDLTGQQIGHYHIIQPIERGGMATVYLARDIHLRREVAIKVFQEQGDQQHSSEFFQRFTHEAQVVARLDHPNILLVHDYGEQDHLAYLVMPYLAGGSLKQLLKERGTLPITEALQIIFPLLDALHYAHDRGLIHRDIKPGNILFKNNQVPVLADFGLVKEMVTHNTDKVPVPGFAMNNQLPLSNGLLMGTPNYMAPEQIRGQVQPQSDIYSLGLVLYEMLTGQLPYATETQNRALTILYKQLYESPRPIVELNAHIPSQLAAAVMHALQKDATQRYQSAADFSQALRAIAPLEIDHPSFEALFPPLESHTSPIDPNATIPLPPEQQAAAAYSTTHGQQPHPSSSNVSKLLPNKLKESIPYGEQNTSLPTRKNRISFLLYGLLTICVLAALSFASIGFPSIFFPKTNALSTMLPPSWQPAATVPMPATQTNCPPAGKARAAVLAPYQAQGHNAIIYASSFYDQVGRAHGTIMSFDIVKSLAHPIITIPELITNAQVSSDGQWIIFSTYNDSAGTLPTPTRSRIQLVRVDGQGLQTLYCSSSTEASLQNLLASPGASLEKDWSLFFADGSTLITLNIATGEILQKFSSRHSYQPVTWLNNQDLYLLDNGTPDQDNAAAQSKLVQLMLNNPLPSADPNLPAEIQLPAACSDLDFSPDMRTIFIGHCSGSGQRDCSGACTPNAGPSTIASIKQNTESFNWNKASPIFTSSVLAITRVRAITSSSLLFLVGNDDLYNNQNGIWKINADGSGLRQLAVESSGVCTFNRFSQYPWSNLARDGSMYAFKTGSPQALGEDRLFIGSLRGGTPTVIAADGKNNVDPGSQLDIAGWTII